MSEDIKIYLETERMILRRFNSEDVQNLLDLDSNEEVRRYLLLPLPPTIEDAERTLGYFLAWHEKSDRYGYWAAIEKSTGEFAGWFHFRPSRENTEEIELGYRLRRDFWGRGLATEVSKALVRKGFEEYCLDAVIATALKANRASIRVMEKIGMKLEQEYLYKNLEAVKYRLSKDEIRS